MTNGEVKIEYYSGISSKSIDWLWYPYIPFGKITLVQGDPGDGKTSFVLTIASILSNGGILPGTNQKVSGVTIYQNTEDGVADTIKPRLEKTGANCKNICFILEGDNPLSLEDCRLEQAIIKTGARLLILDPLQAFIGNSVDMHRANEIRPVMQKLSGIAERTNCAVILVGHLNKKGSGKELYRGLGSIDIAAAVRSILLLSKVNSDDSSLRAVIHMKSNLSVAGQSLLFKIGGDNLFSWVGYSDMTAQEILSDVPVEENKYQRAVDCVTELLSTGVKPASQVIGACENLGIGKRTVEKVKQELSISSFKSGNCWYWDIKGVEGK